MLDKHVQAVPSDQGLVMVTSASDSEVKGAKNSHEGMAGLEIEQQHAEKHREQISPPP